MKIVKRRVLRNGPVMVQLESGEWIPEDALEEEE